MSDNDSYEKLVSDTIAERKKGVAEAVEKSLREAAKKKEEEELIAIGEKQAYNARRKAVEESLFFNLNKDASDTLNQYLERCKQLANFDTSRYDDGKKKIALKAEIEFLRKELSKVEREYGKLTFVKVPIYQCKQNGQDYFILPNSSGNLVVLAGKDLLSLEPSVKHVQVDVNGIPVKLIEHSVLPIEPMPIPILNVQEIVIKEKADLPTPIATKPIKPIFKNQNVAKKDDLSKHPEDKKADNKRWGVF